MVRRTERSLGLKGQGAERWAMDVSSLCTCNTFHHITMQIIITLLLGRVQSNQTQAIAAETLDRRPDEKISYAKAYDHSIRIIISKSPARPLSQETNTSVPH